MNHLGSRVQQLSSASQLTGDILEAPGEPRISTRHGCFVTRGRCEEMAGEQPAGTGRVVLVKKIIMKDGAAVLHETFPQHTFLMNGLIQGVKGLLSFMSAPLIGALSDVWGRRSFLLVTVFFTCAPIPLMRLSPWWYFAMISMSGAFSVTFSVIFAYVADVTDERERSTAYGLVSATFAASLVTSPAIGAYLSAWYGDNLVVLVATLIALADICFILLAVPESLPDKMRLNTWGAPISWEQADPFTSLRKVGQDSTVLLICITVFLSYLPEAGQYSSFFLYLRQVINFSSTTIAVFIGVVGILSIVAQDDVGSRCSSGDVLHHLPSSLCSGVVQGMITGIRGLCNGLGPALYGFVFFLFNVELNTMDPIQEDFNIDPLPLHSPTERALIPGPPFLLGACTVVVAFLVALFIPEKPSPSSSSSQLSLSDKPHPDSKESLSSLAGVHINTPLPGSDEETPPTASNEDFEPLLQDSIV
ncbi:hypothetical protein PAMP_013647 [Pampus punctatissimus]